MIDPVSTYRIQFHKNFTFNDFKSIIPYLLKLGVTSIYASPIFESTSGSTHGYDGVNPLRINPEIGTEEELLEISKTLKSLAMNWIQDIVPNHMAYHPNNTWLMDVFENGPQSEYYNFFDIDWDSPLYNGKVIAPFLGSSLKEAIDKKEISIVYQNEKFYVKYFETAFPLLNDSYELILNHTAENSTLIENLDHKLTTINESPELLLAILNAQVFHLCHWQETDYQINYRRFFTINGLICLNIQNDNVFTKYHSYIQNLLEEKVFQGLRVDHIDGLHDPKGYLERLRKLAGPDRYIVVEKILEPREDLPLTWPVQGTTGYDFLALVNNLLISKNNQESFSKYYASIVENEIPIHLQIKEKKSKILYNSMAGELENLTNHFKNSGIVSKEILEMMPNDQLKKAIGALLIEWPVYRNYGNEWPLHSEELNSLKAIFKNALDADGTLYSGLQLLENILTIPDVSDPGNSEKILAFYQRLMQYTGPLMAKGVEDTLMYTYNRFIGNNEVGDAPETFGILPEKFHATMIQRQKQWPLAMNGTATHDTKRGEDVSARLNVLTDLPAEWIKSSQEWKKANKKIKLKTALDPNDEYLIYQALIAAIPLVEEDMEAFPERFSAYLVKAFREAKIHSNWNKPNETYENSAKEFVEQLLNKNKPFWKSFQKLLPITNDFGMINSLTKVILKFTCPGIPDTYQGCELWDLSLVDPDNRRPVNYQQRINFLEQNSSSNPKDQKEFISELWETRANGNIKLWLTHTLLNLRKEKSKLFNEGKYIPLTVQGKYKDNVFAYARQENRQWIIVATALHLSVLSKQQRKDIQNIDWKDTKIILPVEFPGKWENHIQKSKGNSSNGILVSEIFEVLPLAVLSMELPQTTRAAGILMHITSLPSAYGIGDLGPEAIKFADFLSKSYQRYWQLLPLNVTEKENVHSPYSSISGLAGNTLLISPDLLLEESLLNSTDIEKFQLESNDIVDFDSATKNKNEILDIAYTNFKKLPSNNKLHVSFDKYCLKENEWLHDFAIYVKIKVNHGGEPWYIWPEGLKLRDKKVLEKFANENQEAIQKIKWQQFIFSEQWTSLKSYANKLGIQLFGDLPFYVSYDSADVWSNPDIFSLDAKGNITGVAGVPPDYFNSDGQLWGMPVFNWEALKNRGYDWYILRIKKNLELYDVLRLDHFRAFADYWDVPATEKTAKNGTWKPGPGSDFFKVLEKSLGTLPFIAEDLGDINEGVHALRDEFNFPGMKVLQFAFSEDMPGSIYVPHNYNENYFAYTGTHDNNTTVGWFKQDAGKIERENIEAYTGIKPSNKNIHLILSKLAYASIAKTAILPMQDILGLDENSRMNMPASIEKNWMWRLKPGQLNEKIEAELRKWVVMYNR